MSDDLVKRARSFCIHTPLSKPMITKLADRIEELEAKNARLRYALYRIQNRSYGKNAAIARTTLKKLKGEPKE